MTRLKESELCADSPTVHYQKIQVLRAEATLHVLKINYDVVNATSELAIDMLNDELDFITEKINNTKNSINQYEIIDLTILFKEFTVQLSSAKIARTNSITLANIKINNAKCDLLHTIKLLNQARIETLTQFLKN